MFLLLIGLHDTEPRAQTTMQPGEQRVTIEIEALLARGDSAFAQFNNVDAAEAYKTVIGLDSTEFRALSKLSRVYTTQAKDLLDQNKKNEARVVVEASVQLVDRMSLLYGDRAETQYQLAAAYGNYALFKGGKSKLEIGRKIEGYCLKAIEIDSEYAPPYLILGIFYRKIAELSWAERMLAKTLFGGLPEGGREKAARYLVQAVELDSEMILGWYELGVTRLSLDENEMARVALEKAITLAPRSSNDPPTIELARQLLIKHFD